MDIPYVVNQWWASICSAKQRAPHYLALLRERGYPDYIEQYSAISLGSTLEDDAEQAPWGGLPAGRRVRDAGLDRRAPRHRGGLGRASAAFRSSRSRRRSTTALPERWWERIAHDWEDVVGTARLDLMTAELEQLIALLETRDGRRLDEARLERIARARERAAGVEPAHARPRSPPPRPRRSTSSTASRR